MEGLYKKYRISGIVCEERSGHHENVYRRLSHMKLGGEASVRELAIHWKL